MAIERAFIVCEGCKTYVFVDSCGTGGGFQFSHDIDKINRFISDHEYCTKESSERPDFGFTFGREDRCWSDGYVEFESDEYNAR